MQKGPVEPWIPVIIFAVVFGLSMDYEVFLVSRVREEWIRSHDASSAVAEGLAFTGRVITAAAAIMVCVFLSFMLGNERAIKEFGFGLAAAVFLDAVVVRCVLLPAVLELLGPVTWRLPRWLDARLPHINIEGNAARGAAAESCPRTRHSRPRASRPARRTGRRPLARYQRGGRPATPEVSVRPRGRPRSELVAQAREREHGVRRLGAVVALAPTGALERLVQRIDRQHAKRARDAGAQLDVLDAARALGADIVVVIGLAADDRAEAGDARVAAALRRIERGERQLERTRHVEDVDLVRAV